VVSAHLGKTRERRRAPADGSVVDEPQALMAVLDEQSLDLARIDQSAEEM
jgi:hypothetical protein